MNLDLLKKLTRLANNNPNDNEANLAARKVCKMLEECSFELNNTKQSSGAPNFRTVSNPYGTQYDWFRDMFVKETKYWDNMRNGSWDIPKEPNWDKKTVDPEEYRKAEQKHYQPNTRWYGEPEQAKPTKEKRILTCKLCKKKQETVFAGHESVFECNNCQWTAYTRGKVKHEW